ncbi:hypothetical protein QTP88_010227 [Uroleucon formosanum]
MYEVVLQGVFHETKLCVMSGPDIPIFKKFQKNWVNINKKNFSTWMTDSYVRDKLGYIALNILNFAENKIKEDFPRNDYRELLELIIIFLGGTPLNGIQFRQTGAYHLARWMAKAIYCFKIYIFRHQVKLNHREEIALRDICCFVITCYAENWFTCMDPLNDIFFLRKLVSYKDINPSIANVAIKKFCNHLWYLNEETVMFSIFDERILIEDKRRIVQIILQENYEEDLEVPKRITLKPEEIPEFIKRDIPFELFTTNSLKFFSRFKISSEFLNIDPVEWKNNLEYNNAREIISSIKVVNDTAERNVKLMEDFNQKITKNEEQKQFLLQTETLPTDWGVAYICPIHKNSDKQVCSNYRGISLLDTTYKVLLYCILDRVKPLVEEVVEDYQCGFRQNRSTTDQIFIIRQLFQKSWEYNKELHIIFVDFQKAYDSINRTSITEVLKHFHFQRKIVHLIEASITQTKFKVKVGNSILRMVEVRTGLGQGDALSPILFNIVLEKVIREINIGRDEGVRIDRTCFSLIAYADDIVLLGEEEQSVTSMRQVNRFGKKGRATSQRGENAIHES